MAAAGGAIARSGTVYQTIKAKNQYAVLLEHLQTFSKYESLKQYSSIFSGTLDEALTKLTDPDLTKAVAMKTYIEVMNEFFKKDVETLVQKRAKLALKAFFNNQKDGAPTGYAIPLSEWNKLMTKVNQDLDLALAKGESQDITTDKIAKISIQINNASQLIELLLQLISGALNKTGDKLLLLTEGNFKSLGTKLSDYVEKMTQDIKSFKDTICGFSITPELAMEKLREIKTSIYSASDDGAAGGGGGSVPMDGGKRRRSKRRRRSSKKNKAMYRRSRSKKRSSKKPKKDQRKKSRRRKRRNSRK